MFLIVGIATAIQLPFVQKSLIENATSLISGYINYPIHIGGVAIEWTSNIILSGVEVRDTRNDKMIRIKEIVVDFKLVSLLGRDIIINQITLNQPNVEVKWYREIDDVNISNFIYSLQHMNEDTTKKEEEPVPVAPSTQRRKQFIVTKVKVLNGRFTFNDTEHSRLNDRFDFSNIELKNIALEASVFRLVADTVSFRIVGLSCTDMYSKMKVHRLDAKFGICEHYLKLEELEASIGRSILKNSLIFEYDNYGQLSDIEDSVRMTINLDKSVIHSRDVGVFIPEIKQFGETWRISGLFKGYFNDFRVKKLKLDFGKRSYFEGEAAMKGLPEWDSTFMDLSLTNSIAYASDLERYGLKPYMKQLNKFNKTNLEGTFYGYYHDFQAKGQFITDAGKIQTDFKLKMPDKKGKGNYNGIVQVQELQLDKITENKDFQQLTGNFRIDGKGFDLADLELNLNSSIEKIGIRKYNFQNIISNLRCTNELFQVSLDIKDSGLIMDVISKLDLKNGINKLSMDVSLLKADLQHLKLYDKPLKTGGTIEIDTKGLTLDDIEGSLKCTNLYLKNEKEDITLDSVRLYYIKKDTDNRKLVLNSGLVNMEVSGNLELTKLSKDITGFTKEVFMELLEGDSVSRSYYAAKELSARKNQQITYQMDLKKAGPLCKIFFPNFYISPHAKITGSFISMDKMSININARFDTLSYNGFHMVNTTFDVFASKPQNSSNVSSIMIFKSDNQLINGTPFTENLFLRTSWLENRIDFQASLKQQNETNEAKLAGSLTLDDKHKKLELSESLVKLLDKTWNIDTANEILISEKSVVFKNIHFFNGNQKISAEGEFSANPNQEAIIKVENFELASLNKLVNKKLDGNFNAHISVRDFFTNIKVNSKLNVDSLVINKLYIGNLSGNSKWDDENKKIDLAMELERLELKMFHLDGFYIPNPAKNKENLNITARLNKTHMVVLEPFIKDILSDLKGEATGLIKVTGSLNRPVINGEIEVEDGAFKVNYLNTTYYFNEKIHLYPNGFVMPNIVLDDGEGGLAVLEGGIYHTDFKDFKIAIGGEYKNVKLLATRSKDNDLYYGDAIGTGNFSIKGNFRELDIKVNAHTEKGTKIFLPLNSTDLIEKQGYISFVKKETTGTPKLKKQAKKTDPLTENTDLNLKMEMNIDITPDAYAEIILDPLAGDKIAGHGRGRIKMEFDTEGDFNMYGNYVFAEQSFYLFTFLNVMNKKFNIKRGSSISFNGDPYNGTLDVTASYDDKISLHTLVDTVHQNKSGIRTPYPVSTVLYVKGNILKPTITYDITITDYPSVISGVPLFSYVSAFENKIHNNINEMNTQVFSLLLFRRFMYNASDLSGEGAATSTVSELITNQISQLVSKLDEKLQVDFRLNGLNKDAINTLQLRVSYELLDGKIRITRSGGFTNVQSQATAASIAGDWTVEYMLTDDGKFRAKAFSKNNPNVLSLNSGSAINMATGVSIMHTATFNSINPFERRKKKKKAVKTKDKKTASDTTQTGK